MKKLILKGVIKTENNTHNITHAIAFGIDNKLSKIKYK